MKSILLACLIGSFSLSAIAARPLVTDDARLTISGSCQLESWVRVYQDSYEAWALPACNPTGNLEFTAGGALANYKYGSSSKDYVFQAKTLFRHLETNNWGWGLAFGTDHHPGNSPGPNLLGNTYAYLPVSASFNDDKLVLDMNLGWLKDRATGINNVTWGIGSELQATSSLIVIAETFGDNHNQPYWQIGGRFSIIPNRVQTDATFGQQISGPTSGRWFSIGLRLTPETMF
jgi:hypothetical protein